MMNIYLNTFFQYFKLALKILTKYGVLKSIKLTIRFLETRIQFFLKRVRVKAIPPNYYLFMTKRCNLTCDFCHYYGELDTVDNLESDQEFRLSDLKKFEEERILYAPAKVCLYGGEPMLNKEFFECVEYLNRHGYLSSTITNGSYLKKNLEKLIEIPLHQMTISYYEGLANRFENEIKKISEKTLINISYIIAKDDYRDLEKVILFSISSGAHFITVENIIEKKSCDRKSIISNDDYQYFKRSMLKKYASKIIFRWSEVRRPTSETLNKKIQCSEPWDMILLDKRGKTLPCCQYELKDFTGSQLIAEEVFNTPELMSMREKMSKGEVPKKCEGCHYLYAKDPLYSF